MKIKLHSFLYISLICIFALNTQAFAGSFEPPTETTTISNGEDGKQIIPIYGYIGVDDIIIDPEPEEPEVPPELEVYVKIPVKVLWAAFESDAPNVSSPNYSITNLSSKYPVKVKMSGFVQRATPSVDLGSGMLTLDITTLAGTPIISDVVGKTNVDFGGGNLAIRDRLNLAQTDNKIEFKIGGSWSGNYTNRLTPTYDMTLNFTAVK